MPDEVSTIAELYARDPFELSVLDIDRIIEYYVARRKEFALTGKGGPRIEKPQASLDDLGL
jgi:hypothetical protein